MTFFMDKGKSVTPYDDIMNLPHHVSSTRPHMAVADRAAQFAPFAALTGHDAAIKETARLTDEKLQLDENSKAAIDEKLRYLLEQDESEAIFTYFVPDKNKSGGAYVSHAGVVKKVDTIEQIITLTDGISFQIDDLYRIDGDRFDAEQWL